MYFKYLLPQWQHQQFRAAMTHPAGFHHQRCEGSDSPSFFCWEIHTLKVILSSVCVRSSSETLCNLASGWREKCESVSTTEEQGSCEERVVWVKGLSLDPNMENKKSETGNSY